MAWKLKKANPARDAAELAVPSASEQTIDHSALLGAQPLVHPEAEPIAGLSDDGFGSGTDAVDFLNSRTDAADDAVASFNFAKKSAQPSASGKTASDHDDWSLDAFAPYQPPASFDFSDPLAATGTGVSGEELTHSGMIEFDAEPETLIGEQHSEPTILHSTPLEPTEFGVVDLHETTGAEAFEPIALHGNNGTGGGVIDSFAFAPTTDLAQDPEQGVQFGDAGTLDSYEAQGISEEAPTTLNGFALPVDDFEPSFAAAPPVMPFEPQPAFEERDEALTAMQSPIPMPMPDMDFESVPPLAIPLAPPEPDVNKTLIYGEAADSPAQVPAKPHLVVRFGPFSADYPVTGDDLVIGQPDPNTGLAPDVSLEYDDAVSRRHARVYSDGGQVVLEDLGSKNGTFLNGNMIEAHQPMPLKPGDKIRVGERTEILFQQ